MIWDVFTTILFAILAATTFELTKELYRQLSPDYISRKKILKMIDRLVLEENERLKDPNVYPSSKTSALQRVNCLVYLKEIVKSI